MPDSTRKSNWTFAECCGLLWSVLQGFKRNNGFLLTGAVAYYTLLSLVPLSILILTVLSQFIPQEQLLHTLSAYLDLVVPGYTALMVGQVEVFLAHRHLVGFIGFLVMLFFSSMAFTTLEKAMTVIFFPDVAKNRRTFVFSVFMPYLYIGLMGAGLALVSVIAGAFETLEHRQVAMWGMKLDLAGATGFALYFLGIAGEVLMHASIYLVMPVVRITLRYALIGGIACTVLWEITRRLLVWYYASISYINVIYGSIATVVVAMFCIEIVVLILLLGAQVIVEIERRNRERPEPEGE